MKGMGYLEIAVKKIVRQEVYEVLGEIRSKIKAEYDSIPWRNSDYNDGRIEALEWVYDDVIEGYMDKYKEHYEEYKTN